jgi:hypothetical protein
MRRTLPGVLLLMVIGVGPAFAQQRDTAGSDSTQRRTGRCRPANPVSRRRHSAGRRRDRIGRGGRRPAQSRRRQPVRRPRFTASARARPSWIHRLAGRRPTAGRQRLSRRRSRQRAGRARSRLRSDSDGRRRPRRSTAAFGRPRRSSFPAPMPTPHAHSPSRSVPIHRSIL